MRVVAGQLAKFRKGDVSMSEQLDEILNNISLAFGIDNLEVVFPEDTLVELSLFRISKIDATRLDEELVFEPKVYMLFCAILAHVSNKYERMEAHVEQLDAKLSLKYEKHLISSDERVSDKKIDKLVKADDDYVEAVNKCLEYKNMVITFRNILNGLDKKHDGLMQLSSKRNKEISQRMI
jgi:hypothetical protein